MVIRSEQIKEYAAELGFVLCGISRAAPVSAEVAIGYSRYIVAGNHARMDYLSRNIEKRLDISQLVEGAQSVISCAVSYNNPEPFVASDGDLYIARYARFTDYHEIIRGRLKLLADRISQHYKDKPCGRCFVDTAPLLEKYYARKGGLGWIGKNNLLINERYGSQILLGEIVIDKEFEYDQPVESACGDCQLCIESCPGGAINVEGEFDSNKCVSYHTIESKEPVPQAIVKALAGKVFGCDYCQRVCPYNQNAELNSDPELIFQYAGITRDELERITQEEFKRRFAGTAIVRAGLERMRYIASFSKDG